MDLIGPVCFILFFAVLFALLGFNPIGDLNNGDDCDNCDCDSPPHHNLYL